MVSYDLPYFDQIIERLEALPDSSLARAFERHVHWGYFSSPETADDSVEHYVAAAEELTRRMCEAAGMRDDLTILDVGCGFGGTVDHLNAHLSGCELVGLNIDARQLDRARDLVQPRAENTVSFVEGDACSLPFEDGHFDTVLAIECAFHFRSRKQFFREVRRVSKPGASLVLSDFILNDDRIAELGKWLEVNNAPSNPFYGSNRIPPSSGSYTRIAKGAGMRLTLDEDITANTLPTYAAMRRLYREAGLDDGVESTTYLEELARRDFVRYHVLRFACASPE